MKPAFAVLALAAAASLAGPAAATAATVGTEPDGRLVYRAAGGELNDVTVRVAPDTNHTLLFTEARAFLIPLAGCLPGAQISCQVGSESAIFLGDRDDRASQRTGTFTASNVFGERGDDDIVSSGGQALGDGGAGDDTVRVNSNGDSVGRGGPGEDALTATSVAFAVLSGDEGSDVLSAFAPNVRLDGGEGADTIAGTTSFAGFGVANGGGGSDRIAAAGEGNGWRIDAGRGNDYVDTRVSTADTVACGTGSDVVDAGAEDTVASDCELVRRPSPATTLRGRGPRPL